METVLLVTFTTVGIVLAIAGGILVFVSLLPAALVLSEKAEDWARGRLP